MIVSCTWWIFRESKGWDSELASFNHWCPLLTMAFKKIFPPMFVPSNSRSALRTPFSPTLIGSLFRLLSVSKNQTSYPKSVSVLHFSDFALNHCLTPEKGVHSFRYFQLQMLTPKPIVDCSCTYAFCIKMRLSLISIQNAYMHEETTIGFGVRIWGRKYLNECTPFSGVRQWNCTPEHTGHLYSAL